MVKASVSVTKIIGPKMGYGNLGGMSVLVGVPQKTKNQGRKPGGINNASLLFIFSNGSVLRNIPPRPVLEPAIQANQQYINKELEKAVAAALRDDPEGVELFLERAGTVAANACKQWFFDSRNGWKPNSPATIRRKGSSVPGIDTGAMRRSITYVVLGKFKKQGSKEMEEKAKEKKRKAEQGDAEEAPETQAARKAGQEAGESMAEGIEEAAETAGELGGELLEGGAFLL